MILYLTNKQNLSLTNGCFRFIDSYSFLSNNLDFLVKTLFDKSHRTLKIMKKEAVDDDEKLDIVKEIENLNKEDAYKNDSLKN